MKKPTLYHYLSYREYLKECLESAGPRSGDKRRASEFLQVHTTFISQVVLGKADFSLDQAEKMNVFLNHSDEEGEYFLNLLIFERAGDSKLKKRYEDKLIEKQNQKLQIKERLSGIAEFAEKDHEKFYSSHLYGLLHVLSSIPKYQRKEELAKATGLPIESVDEALQFLVEIGILQKSKDQYLPGKQHIHLGKNSKNISRHHTNWRLATIQHFAFTKPKDLHYSLAFSCSEKEAKKIRESLLQHLKEMTELVSDSKEENAYVYCFDFFSWT